MAVGYIWITKTPFVEHSRQVKVFVSRIFGTIAEDAHKLVIAFLFVSNHSTWSMGFSAAPARVQALNSSNVGAFYSHTRVASYKYISFLNVCGKFKHRRRRKSYHFQRRALGRTEIKRFLPKSDKFSHQVPSRDNCEIKNGGKRMQKFGQPWLLLTVQHCYICVRVRSKNFLSLSLFFFFFHCSPMKIR